MYRHFLAGFFAQFFSFLSAIFAYGKTKHDDDKHDDGDDDGQVINGTRGNDDLVGTAGDDIINGGRGNDDIDGDDGDDRLNGGRGDDNIRGGRGDDTLDGGRGDDDLRGGRGDDTLYGGRGDDDLRGGRGDDDLDGGRGDDDLNGGRGDDVLRGGRGDDRLTGGAGDDEIDGGTGNDTVIFRAGDGNDTVDGGADGADTRPATSADDIALGDTIDLSGFGAGVRVDLDENNQGVLQPENELSNDTRTGLSEFGNVRSGDAVVIAELNDMENVIGTDFNDTIFGNAQNNVLLGGDGNDVLHPFGGLDFVDGGAGTDTLLLNGFKQGSVVDVAAGTATFIGDRDPANLFANIENVNGSSVAGDHITGDDQDNVLNGLGGDDTLVGGGGNDTLIGGDNVDRARADAQGDNEDELDGGEGDDFLDGGAGNDTLTGGANADTFFFEEGDSGGETEITDFTIADDRFELDAETFGLASDAGVVFRNVERDGDGLDAGLLGFEAGTEDTNVYVLQGAFANAGAAANAIANALTDNGLAQDDDQSGFFVYFNDGQGRNRLFAVDDLDEVDPAVRNIQHIANLGDRLDDVPENEAAREEALNSLPNYTEANFVFSNEDELSV